MNRAQSMRIIRKTKANYNRIAKEWGVSRHRPSLLKIKLLKGIKKGFDVLDIGCGNGFLLPEVLKRGGQYTGLDVSAKLIKIARQKFSAEIITAARPPQMRGRRDPVRGKKGGARFMTGDALKLPFKNNGFDFVFSFAVMHHIPSSERQLKFLSEVHRVLKKGGRAVITNWNLLNDWSDNRFGISKQLKNPAAGFCAGDVYVPWRATSGYKIKRFFHIFSKKELLALIKKAGFKKYRITYRDREGKLVKNGEEQVLTLRK